ncbi:MAG: cupin, partial [Hyphomicrobiales bacterium]
SPVAQRLRRLPLAGRDHHLRPLPGQWQAAQSLGNWTLVGCTVAPGFQFEHFEMADAGWQPGA